MDSKSVINIVLATSDPTNVTVVNVGCCLVTKILKTHITKHTW